MQPVFLAISLLVCVIGMCCIAAVVRFIFCTLPLMMPDRRVISDETLLAAESDPAIGNAHDCVVMMVRFIPPCYICLDLPASKGFCGGVCGHGGMCSVCFERIRMQLDARCPLCRAPLARRI